MRSPHAVSMTPVQLARLTFVTSLFLICVGCGETFRPVANPIPGPPGNPSGTKFVYVVARNGDAGNGSSTRIDVSGDTNVGQAKVGFDPVHAGLLGNGSRIFVANRGEDTVTTYGATGTSPEASPVTIALPPGSRPAFVHTTQTDRVYVANPGNDTVSVIDATPNVVSHTVNLAAGADPVALIETPNAQSLYSVNKGNGTLSSISTTDFTVKNVIAVGSTPVWAVARSDSKRVYVLNQGSGTISVIDPLSDTQIATANVAAGANFMFYDKTRNRIYVNNPVAKTVTIVNAAVDPTSATDPLFLVKTLSLAPITPIMVAALPDGSAAYVAGYDPSLNPLVTPIDATANLLGTSISLPVNVSNPATTTESGCADPSKVPFRLSIAAGASDQSSLSTRVYVANCDSGSTTILKTLNQSTVLSIVAPPSIFPPINVAPCPDTQPTCADPPPQAPVFILAGP